MKKTGKVKSVKKAKVKKQSAADRRKEALIVAGLKAFCENGYQNTTVDDITKNARCSHGLFYHYFKTKKELLDAMLAKNNGEKFVAIKKKIDKTEDYCEKLNIILSELFSQARNDELFSYHFYFFISRKFNDNKLKNSSDKSEQRAPIEFFTAFFSEGQKHGYFKTDYPPKECALILNSIISGAALGYVVAPKEIAKDFSLPEEKTIVDIFRKEK